jgi:ParB/RepB/Spo0J family partition protein
VFEEADLDDLANSIREKGVIQPILARTVPGVADAYEIIAGERRWRAAQRASLHDVPIIVVEVGDREALELAIVENVQRADLNALEEAMGYEQLANEFSYSQNDLARIIGKSRSHIANTLRLLKLPEGAKKYLAEGAISAGHARALLTMPDADAVARKIVDRGLTVRDVEKLAQDAQEPKTRSPARVKDEGADADTRALEKALDGGAWAECRHFAPRRGRRSAYSLQEPRSARRALPAPQGLGLPRSGASRDFPEHAGGRGARQAGGGARLRRCLAERDDDLRQLIRGPDAQLAAEFVHARFWPLAEFESSLFRRDAGLDVESGAMQCRRVTQGAGQQHVVIAAARVDAFDRFIERCQGGRRKRR